MRICVFEDAAVTGLQPMSLTRPVFDLRCGAVSLLERQLRSLPSAKVSVLIRPVLAGLCQVQHPDLVINDAKWLASGATEMVLLVNGRWFLPGAVELRLRPEIGLVGEQVAYVMIPADKLGDLSQDTLPRHLDTWKESLPHAPARGAMIDHPWDLVEHNAAALEQDYQYWLTHRGVGGAPAISHPGESPATRPGVHLLGPAKRVVVDSTARIEPMVLIDTTRGPVIIDHDVVVQAFSRIEGPCYLGPGTQVFAGRVRGSSIGPQCRIGGEVEASIIYGYSNKAHDGFLGHSYLGEWVNLGAGTQTSDLRNDYGKVGAVVAGRKLNTGLLKVGSFIGDHTKTSIGTLFNTGSVIGPCSQLLASGTLLPKVLPAFCQFRDGQEHERTDLREMFTTAAAMMGRRNQVWTEAHAEFFFDLYESTAGERLRVMQDNQQRRSRRVV
jgi:UDP-N-acetylglucosamine diphosphorylase/glucosamine-1-phosphate N-acetyltransferase